MKTNRRSFFASVVALFAAKPILPCVPKVKAFDPRFRHTISLRSSILMEAPWISKGDFRIPFTIINGAKSGGKCE